MNAAAEIGEGVLSTYPDPVLGGLQGWEASRQNQSSPFSPPRHSSTTLPKLEAGRNQN